MKRLVILVVVAFATSNVQAQDINFGVKGGVNFADLVGDEVEELDMTTGFHVGAVAEIMFTEKFGFQPEITYSTQGAKASYSENEMGITYSAEETVDLSYINVPLLAKYYVFEGLHLELGPQIGYLLAAEGEWEWEETINGETFSGSGTEDYKDDLNSIDVGFAAGVGYKMDMGLFVNARYVLGLRNVNKDGDEDFSQRNRMVQLSIGYML